MTQAAATPNETWTVGKLLSWTLDHFRTNGMDEPRLAAELLLASALGCRKIELYTRYEAVPSTEERSAFRHLVRAAAGGAPIAHLVGCKEFYSLEFEVTGDVLIPRPETELLVERALLQCGAWAFERFDILDVGTGSGCIAVSVAARQPAARVVASDCSAAALEIAKRNARRHGVSDSVRLVRADMLDLPADSVPEQGFDLVLSNPPYISEDDPSGLAEDVKKFEPSVALYGGPDGLTAFRRIAEGAGRILKPSGFIFVEIGCGQAPPVESVFSEHGMVLRHRFADLTGKTRVLQFGPAQ